MEFIDYLKNLIKTKEESAAQLRSEIKAAETADEVRALGDSLQSVLDELSEATEQLKSAEKRENESGKDANNMDERGKPTGQDIPADAQFRNGRILGSYFAPEPSKQEEREKGYGSMEYRAAFKDYVQRGTQIPNEVLMRAGGDTGTTVTEDIGAIIPETIMNEFIKETSKVRGNIYSKVRKLNIKGGVKFPISQLKASVKWIAEGAVSNEQKAGDVKNYIVFEYNICEIRIATSLLAQIVSLDLFEAEIVRIMADAYLEAMDKAIICGTGEGQPLGITKDSRVTNVVTMTEKEFSSWTAWRKKLFSKVPLSKRGRGEFLFPSSTVESYLLTMVDADGNPVFREPNTPNATFGATAGNFFGRTTDLVEPDVIGDFATASAGDVVGVYWIPNDYGINENLQFGMRRYFDEGANEWINKGLAVTDGKILDPSGCYLIKKAVASS